MADELKPNYDNEKTKTVSDWEQERNFIITTDVSPNKKLTEREFMELALDETKAVGVDHKERTKFLEANGYEVTRANMADNSLTPKVDDENDEQ